jgi:P27 family predicted phage terminase small subunit
LGLLAEIDRAALAAYCDSWGIFVRVRRLLANIGEDGTDGLLTKTAQGKIVQNPLVAIINKAKHDLMLYAEQFGMTPSARARVNGSGVKESADPANKYFPR